MIEQNMIKVKLYQFYLPVNRGLTSTSWYESSDDTFNRIYEIVGLLLIDNSRKEKTWMHGNSKQ